MKKPAMFGYAVGVIIALFVLAMLPLNPVWHQPGPANAGHEQLDCADCHVAAAGTSRQQIQANVRYVLGLRRTGVAFGHYDVTNGICLACHDRPGDHHPVYRFLEPRFLEARKAIQPQFCESCHREHQGQRVTIDPLYCVHCHTDLNLLEDPIDVAHVDLVASQDWASCLGCHDFHGNHVRDVPVRMADRVDPDRIANYFRNGPSPYSDTRQFQAQRRRDD